MRRSPASAQRASQTRARGDACAAPNRKASEAVRSARGAGPARPASSGLESALRACRGAGAAKTETHSQQEREQSLRAGCEGPEGGRQACWDGGEQSLGEHEQQSERGGGAQSCVVAMHHGARVGSENCTSEQTRLMRRSPRITGSYAPTRDKVSMPGPGRGFGKAQVACRAGLRGAGSGPEGAFAVLPWCPSVCNWTKKA